MLLMIREIGHTGVGSEMKILEFEFRIKRFGLQIPSWIKQLTYTPNNGIDEKSSPTSTQGYATSDRPKYPSIPDHRRPAGTSPPAPLLHAGLGWLLQNRPDPG